MVVRKEQEALEELAADDKPAKAVAKRIKVVFIVCVYVKVTGGPSKIQLKKKRRRRRDETKKIFWTKVWEEGILSV